MVGQQSSDRGLIDLREERDHLSVQLSLIKDVQRTPASEILRLQREIELLDRRINNRARELNAQGPSGEKRPAATRS
jgi:hypothetical protein